MCALGVARVQGRLLSIDGKDKLLVWSLSEGRMAGSAPRSMLLPNDQTTYAPTRLAQAPRHEHHKALGECM
jgi:hypothetical protein